MNAIHIMKIYTMELMKDAYDIKLYNATIYFEEEKLDNRGRYNKFEMIDIWP